MGDGRLLIVAQLLSEVTKLLDSQLPRDEGSFERLDTLGGEVSPLSTSCRLDQQESTFNHPSYRRRRFSLAFVWTGFPDLEQETLRDKRGDAVLWQENLLQPRTLGAI